MSVVNYIEMLEGMERALRKHQDYNLKYEDIPGVYNVLKYRVQGMQMRVANTCAHTLSVTYSGTVCAYVLDAGIVGCMLTRPVTMDEFTEIIRQLRTCRHREELNIEAVFENGTLYAQVSSSAERIRVVFDLQSIFECCGDEDAMAEAKTEILEVCPAVERIFTNDRQYLLTWMLCEADTAKLQERLRWNESE